jgi:transposase
MVVRKKIFIKASRSDVERFRKETKDKNEYRRASAILLHADGKSYREVAEMLGVKRNAGVVWVRNFRNKGLEALNNILAWQNA